MNSRYRAIALAGLFALTFAIGITEMSANNSLNDLGYNCALPDPAIAWYNGGTGGTRTSTREKRFPMATPGTTTRFSI